MKRRKSRRQGQLNLGEPESSAVDCSLLMNTDTVVSHRLADSLQALLDGDWRERDRKMDQAQAAMDVKRRGRLVEMREQADGSFAEVEES